MPTDIARCDVQRLIDEGAMLLEVLPSSEYDTEHLPGALNLPLAEINRDSVARLRQAPIIVYCQDVE